MDIRNFFGKKPAGGKKSSSSATSKAAAPTKTSATTTKTSDKKKPAKAAAASPSPKKKPNKIDNDKNKPKAKTTSKKEKETVTTPAAFFANMSQSRTGGSSSSTKRKAAVAPAPTSTTKTASPLKKVKTASPPPPPTVTPKAQDSRKTTSPAKEKAVARSPSPIPVVEKTKEETKQEPKKETVLSKRAAPASPVTPKAKAATTTPKKKARITPPKKKKREILDPTTTVESFDRSFHVKGIVNADQVLDGLTFVLTGLVDDQSSEWGDRETVSDLLKSLGGRVTGCVSGKTTYLIVLGDLLEDGRPHQDGSKYQTAMEKETVRILVRLPKLFGIISRYCQAQRTKEQEEGIAAPVVVVPKTATTKSAVAANPYANKAAVANNPYAKTSSNNPYAKSGGGSSNPYAKKASTAATEEPTITKGDEINSLWTDRHAPKHTREILGNKENIRKLQNWLQHWERTFLHGKGTKSLTAPKGPWKAALLSGPPGIGKTTTATLVALEANRDLLEFNASDARSKKALQSTLGDITGSQALNFGVPAKKSSKPAAKKLRCIIMDEVDGMGGGDRSGMAELIAMIKKSKVPMICICNDRQSQKMKSLLPYCMDLRFQRPVKTSMANRAVRIAQMEGLHVERNAAEAIAESCGNDVRQVLNVLQMWAAKGGGEKLTYQGLKDREKSIKKDEMLRVSLFDAAKNILEGRRNLAGTDLKTERDSFFKRTDSFFVDYSMVGMLVQQNYPRVMQGQYQAVKKKDDHVDTLAFLERVHQAAASMSDYAVFENEIRSGDMNWSLLPTSASMAVATGYHAGGESGGFLPGYPEFTAWMGKNSSKGKKMRLLNELAHHMNFKITGDSQEVRQAYLPVMRERFLKLLKSGEKEANAKVIELMDDYGLSREDVIEKLDEFRMGKDGPSFADLESKQKAAFTRDYNAGSHTSQALVAEQGGGGKKKAKRSTGKALKDPNIIDEDGGDASEEDNDDEEDMKKLQEKFKKKGRKKAAAGGKKKAAAKKAKK